MKIRSGFVSNSSTSSFICDVCGADESGYDLPLSETGMVQCEHGHTVCIDHTDKDPRVNKLLDGAMDPSEFSLDEIQDIAWVSMRYILRKEYETKENFKEKTTLQDIEEAFGGKELDDITLEDIHYEFPSRWCPICSFKMPDPDVLMIYLMYKQNITIDILLEQAKREYKDYKLFSNAIANMRKVVYPK